jgi:hypothetical protein
MMVCTRQMLTVIKGVTPLMINNHFSMSVNGDLPTYPNSLMISPLPQSEALPAKTWGAFFRFHFHGKDYVPSLVRSIAEG